MGGLNRREPAGTPPRNLSCEASTKNPARGGAIRGVVRGLAVEHAEECDGGKRRMAERDDMPKSERCAHGFEPYHDSDEPSDSDNPMRHDGLPSHQIWEAVPRFTRGLAKKDRRVRGGLDRTGKEQIVNDEPCKKRIAGLRIEHW